MELVRQQDLVQRFVKISDMYRKSWVN